ncbi:short-chain fatty acid transporter [Pseudoalteromonas sp. T1lg10]|uniref:short-chain fatty acid transporter n=1 Tax=Pseudoalteromonas sp. T1lg10 TaxID=2077093 RepID=UPI000CF6A530|nr:TIGR00366 family protein [Pseudoalteromonas sp. T1lg10]
MLAKIAKPIAKLTDKYMPDPLLIVMLLTLVSFALALISSDHSPLALVQMWGGGISNLFTFAMQMLLVLVCGYLLATTPSVERGLNFVARRLNTPGKAVVVTNLVALLASWLNWGFGLVVGALFAKAVARFCRVDYRVLVASAYSGFIIWHGGLSGSIPLTIATPGHFAEQQIGLIDTSQTLFSTLNLALVIGLAIILPLLNYWLLPKAQDAVYVDTEQLQGDKETSQQNAAGNALEQARWPTATLGLLGLIYLGSSFYTGAQGLNLNTIIALFLFFALLLQPNTSALISQLNNAVRSGSGIVIQFPFYAGLMALMSQSGLAKDISELFIALSDSTTLPIWSFLSAGLVNIFVPSGGGQWAVQAPLLLPAAQALEVPVSSVALAVAWGDAWTNLIQPFWAIPVLAIAGLKAKDIMGFCLIQLLVSGLYIILLLALLA